MLFSYIVLDFSHEEHCGKRSCSKLLAVASRINAFRKRKVFSKLHFINFMSTLNKSIRGRIIIWKSYLIF